MEYNVIQYRPNEEIDTLFKRIILKLCQLYPFHKNEIQLITKQLQDYRDLLKSKDYASINIDNVKQALKKFDDKLAQFYNNESIARQIYLKQLKLMHKLLKEEFKEDEFKNLPFQKLYLVNKEKYELLNDELKDIFFDYYTSNKKVKPVMELLKLWYSLKEKKIRNLIRSEINQFKSELNASAFKEVKKDTRDYITKTNEELAKSIRGEVKQIVEGGPLDKLRFITSQAFDIAGLETKINNEFLTKLNQFKLLKDKYKPLIYKYENAREDDKFNIRRDIENALYDIKPVYEYCKEAYDNLKAEVKRSDKKYELSQLISKINDPDFDKDKLNYLFYEFAKYSSLFGKDKDKYEKLIADKYKAVFRSNVEEILHDELIKLIKFYKNNPPNKKYQIKYTTNKTGKIGQYTDTFNKDWLDTIKAVLNKSNILPSDPRYNQILDKFNTDEMSDKLIFEVEEEAAKKKAEEEAAKKKAEEEAAKLKEAEEAAKKKAEEEAAKLKAAEEAAEDAEDAKEKDGEVKAKGCNIFDIQKKTLTQILQEINDKYNKLPNQKLDGIIYINLKKRFPNKEDFNKFFIQQLKKFDKKYNYDKYKQYMSDKKYSKKYIEELNKGGFLGPLLGGIINVGKKIFGLNDDAIKASGPLSSLLNMIGLNDKTLSDKDIKAGGIFSKILNFIGLSDDVLENDELLIKIKPFIDLFKKEKDNKKIDSYLYAIVKLEMDDEPEDKIKEVYNNLLFKYDELYRAKLHKERLNKDFYNNKGGFAPALLGLIPMGINAISGLISSISQAARGNNENKLKSKSKSKKSNDNNVFGCATMTLGELQELKNKIN